jgi:hypothetical protein
MRKYEQIFVMELDRAATLEDAASIASSYGTPELWESAYMQDGRGVFGVELTAPPGREASLEGVNPSVRFEIIPAPFLVVIFGRDDHFWTSNLDPEMEDMPDDPASLSVMLLMMFLRDAAAKAGRTVSRVSFWGADFDGFPWEPPSGSTNGPNGSAGAMGIDGPMPVVVDRASVARGGILAVGVVSGLLAAFVHRDFMVRGKGSKAKRKKNARLASGLVAGTGIAGMVAIFAKANQPPRVR